MIKIENVETAGWGPALRGMRNPMNSWDKADSTVLPAMGNFNGVKMGFHIGDADHSLAMRLRNAGTDHRKFLRMIVCYCDITAPLYWWKEFDTYRNGVEKNSCSTMHCIHKHEFTLDDFSTEHLEWPNKKCLEDVICQLNIAREWYKRSDGTKKDWWQLIQLLPSSYNQRRTVMMSYEALTNMYHARKNHKLDEWREFCKWIESLPYSELITGERDV